MISFIFFCTAAFALPELERQALLDFWLTVKDQFKNQAQAWPITAEDAEEIERLQALPPDLDPCPTDRAPWPGIECDTADGMEGATGGMHVRGLLMEGWFNGGTVPASLSHLKFVRKLDLGGNHFTGTLPPELGKLRHIENLELDSNRFDGLIPESWTKLRLLRSATSDHNPREGAPTGGAGVFVGFNTHPSGKHGFECPYPPQLLAATDTSTPNSTVATSWGLKRECGLNSKDDTPDEEFPPGQGPPKEPSVLELKQKKLAQVHTLLEQEASGKRKISDATKQKLDKLAKVLKTDVEKLQKLEL